MNLKLKEIDIIQKYLLHTTQKRIFILLWVIKEEYQQIGLI
jgi:hypothetical protein